mgnify:FL=1
MLHPSYNELINAVNKDVEQGEPPVVQSRYSIVIATAKRARQLISQDGENSENTTANRNYLSIAIDELYKEKIKILPEEKAE